MRDDFETRYARHKELCAKANELNKAILLDAFTPSGITAVQVEFDGYGDSGQIHDVTAWAGDKSVAFPSVRLKLHRAEWGARGTDIERNVNPEGVEDLCFWLPKSWMGQGLRID